MLALAVTSAAIILLFLLAYLAFVHHNIPALWCAPLPVPVAIYGVSRYRIRTEERNKTFRLKQFYERGVTRLEDRWRGSGCSGEMYAPEAHPYERGLNIFGAGSLFELLCTCRTEIGRRCLADYLLSAPSVDEIRERQEAVRELSRRIDLQERVALLGKFDAQQSHLSTFTDWMDAPRPRIPTLLAPLTLLTSTSLGVLLLFWLNHTMAWATAGIPTCLLLLAHLVIGLIYRDRLIAFFDRLRPLGPELDVLRSGLKMLEPEHFESVKLRRIAKTVRSGNAAGAIGRLAKLVEVLSQRDKEYFFAISRVLLIGLQTALRVEKWQKKHGDSLKDWLSGWGEFDALLALGVYAREHPQNVFPGLLTDETAYQGCGIGNPLLSEPSSVPNDVVLNGETRFYVISGSNMAGKSTLLRTVGLNAVLAYSGAPVPAQSLQLSVFSICASLAVVDSLREGKSKFLAEIDRLRQAIEAVASGEPLLFLFDEILSGTNSRDRRTAAEAIVRFLVEHGALGMLSTHDLALTEIASPEFGGRNVHMGSRDSSDPLDFDYLLKPGVTTEANAIEIARMAGVPV